ncbi:hypothetical protein QCN27_09430 [Cereibacter sp. SYSU M97828]|nr:hypothetical protein [Cereibacter flavus]
MTEVTLSAGAETLLEFILRHPTASAALEAWCGAGLPGHLSARVIEDRELPRGTDTPLDGAPLRYRRVELAWADTVVSRAENWYLPDRLPPGVASRLLTTGTPFGVLLEAYAPERRLMAASTVDGADHILEMHAALSLPGRGDVAVVRELYAPALLALKPSS